jgi:hypothetical protein
MNHRLYFVNVVQSRMSENDWQVVLELSSEFLFSFLENTKEKFEIFSESKNKKKPF